MTNFTNSNSYSFGYAASTGSNPSSGSGQTTTDDRDKIYIDKADKTIRDFDDKFKPKGGSGGNSSGSSTKP